MLVRVGGRDMDRGRREGHSSRWTEAGNSLINRRGSLNRRVLGVARSYSIKVLGKYGEKENSRGRSEYSLTNPGSAKGVQ